MSSVVYTAVAYNIDGEHAIREGGGHFSDHGDLVDDGSHRDRVVSRDEN